MGNKLNTPNPNRVITLTANNKSDSVPAEWRYSLRRILEKTNREYTPILDTVFKDTDVDDRIHLLMTSPPKTMKTSNKFVQPVENLLKGGGGKTSGTLGKIADAFNIGFNTVNAVTTGAGYTSATWQPWMTGVKSWDGSRSGFAFDYEFSFAMGQYGLWNAKEEVVKPILNLIAPALPRSLNNYSMNGPFPTAIQLLSLMVTDGIGRAYEGLRNSLGEIGDRVVESLDSGDASSLFKDIPSVNDVLSSLSDTLNSIIMDTYKDYTFTVKFGNFVTFNNLIITNGETSFSNEVDQNGYPVAGTAKLSFEGLVPLAMTYKDFDLVAIKYGGKENNEY